MNNEQSAEAAAPYQGQPGVYIDFAKVDALRKHMLLTVESIITLFGVTRVSYYGWLKGKPMRKGTADKVRKVVRSLVGLVSTDVWPNEAVYVANQKQRLKMLQEQLETLDKNSA